MARLIRRVAIGKVVPRCAGSHYPKDAVENFACIFPRPSPTVGSTRRKGDQRIENGPFARSSNPLPLLYNNIPYSAILIVDFMR